jgi:hypothetical protein
VKAAEFPLDEYFVEFGEDASYTDPDGEVSTIQVVFDWAQQDSAIESVTVQNRDTKATVRTSDVPTVNNKATLTLAGVTYKIAKVEPDASGLTILHLTLD